LGRVKSEIMRNAILEAARRQFSKNGYVKTTINMIAKAAGTAPSNVYVYFGSKLEIALAIYEPWFKNQILALEKVVAKKRGPKQKLACLVEGLLRNVANDKRGRTATLMAAFATATPPDGYRPDLLIWGERRLAAMIEDILGGGQKPLSFARMLMVIFDGVAIRGILMQDKRALSALIKSITGRLKSRN
jgi:AcrR family transcriptional regulator